ncbi:hypothetical protein GR238_34570 [Rhizobium leguminosarum]|uniref:hypothetical protein n=1 Tax=Rhizobium ruizarguesonis TaxID=2081791 RepID=UPI0013B7FA18|nr:hypothetical protein [Rhizobium ruizarguesonis]NEJ10486.1 hypothetical protein [Rhizobium ruizarguesonis]
MLLKFTTAALIATLAGQVAAQVLEPKDYSPTEDATIRTVRLKDRGSGHYSAMVAIANRSSQPFNTNYDCTLFDAAGTPYDNAGGSAQAVPPGQEVSSQTSSFSPKPAKVACRIEFVVPAR